MLAYLTWNPLPIDADVLKAAKELERRYRLSWWDCTIVAAAQTQGCELLLTEDLQDGLRIGSLVVRSPFALEAREAVAEYEAAPRARALHRPRGRRECQFDRPEGIPSAARNLQLTNASRSMTAESPRLPWPNIDPTWSRATATGASQGGSATPSRAACIGSCRAKLSNPKEFERIRKQLRSVIGD